MKILIVTARYHPETFSITNIAEQFVAFGHNVTVLTGRPHYGLGKPYPGYEKFVRDEIINGVKVIRVNEHIRKRGTLSLIQNYLSIKSLFKKELKRIDGSKFDVVISHVISPIFTMEGIEKFCKKYNIPHLHYGLDLWPESFIATGFLKRNGLLFNIMKKYCIKLYKGCDYITFASPCTESYFHDYLKVDTPFKHIYQPCLTLPPKMELLDSHEFKKDGRIRILYCGTIAKFHHLDIFIDALHNIPNANQTFSVDIVGSGSELENIKELVKDYHMEDVVTFYGRVSKEETINYYLKADVLFVPLFKNSYTSDMIPQKVIEYFMYGKPILGMLFGDGRDLIEKASKNNILCDTNQTALCESLSLIAKYDEKTLNQTGKENRNFFDSNKRFSLPTVCKELLDLCDELIKNKNREGCKRNEK